MLERPLPTLPSERYFDPAVFERELRGVFGREWVCVGREADWPDPGSYRLVRLAGQRVLVVRSPDSGLNAFFDTCRHRGSALCERDEGRFGGGRIVCPYHAWVYDLEGRLLGTPKVPEEFLPDRDRLGLYPVALDCWGGFVFLNLAGPSAPGLAESLGGDARLLDRWPLETLAVARRESHRIACNWKVFWENFMECLHCPVVHPDLCRLVPMYGQGVNSQDDLPEGHPLREAGRLRDGAATWSPDGATTLPPLPGLGEEELAAGMTFFTSLPSMFVVAHADYVRSVRVVPAAPEQTELEVDWLVHPDALSAAKAQVERLTEFGRRVVLEDARVCELNQLGLRNRAHREGMLMPQEFDVRGFHEWLEARTPE